MDKSIIKKDIAALVKTINEQYATIENTAHCSQQYTATLIHTVEKLYKKAVVFDFVNSLVPVVETKPEPAPIAKPVVEKIVVQEETSVLEPIQPPVTEVRKEELLSEPKISEKVVISATPTVTQIAKEQVLTPEIKSTPKRDIKTSIGMNEKFEFIRELFNGDAGDYEKSVQLFNNAVNGEAALKLINDLQKKYNWQEDNETAGRFWEIIKMNVR